MHKLTGRDFFNTYKIAQKVNEIIDLLEAKDIIKKEEDIDKILRGSKHGKRKG